MSLPPEDGEVAQEEPDWAGGLLGPEAAGAEGAEEGWATTCAVEEVDEGLGVTMGWTTAAAGSDDEGLGVTEVWFTTSGVKLGNWIGEAAALL